MRKNKLEAPGRQHPETVTCRSCGAVFSGNEPNCPYCGTMYLPAAETAYMHKLDHVRTGLEKLGEKPQRAMRTNLRRLRKRLIIPVVLLLIAIIAGFAVHEAEERKRAEQDRADAVWQIEYFPRMDAAYEEGDYDRLDELYYGALDEGHWVYNYKHRAFCEFYRSIRYADEALQAYNAGEYDEVSLLYFELQVCELEALESFLTPDEYSRLLELRKPTYDDLTARFQLSDEEISAFRKTVRENGFVSYEDCEKFLEDRGK